MTRITRSLTPNTQPVTGHGPDADRTRLLFLLASEACHPPMIEELRERGTRMPGQAIYELELDGNAVERVHRTRTLGCRRLRYRLGGPSPHIAPDRSYATAVN